jgi:ribosomal-protein-alanine acetyltransferase
MNEPAITLRSATPDDVEAIVAIERSAFSDPWSARSFRELLGRPEVVFEVAEMAEYRVAGFAIVYLADFEGDLANLATTAAVRRQGVGRRLLRHVLATARVRGGRIIFLEVRASNAAARALYESEGFVEVGRRAKYYARPVEDALILRTELE